MAKRKKKCLGLLDNGMWILLKLILLADEQKDVLHVVWSELEVTQDILTTKSENIYSLVLTTVVLTYVIKIMVIITIFLTNLDGFGKELFPCWHGGCGQFMWRKTGQLGRMNMQLSHARKTVVIGGNHHQRFPYLALMTHSMPHVHLCL